MLLSIQLELITTKMEKDRQYFEIKNNFKNSFYKKYINLCKKVKHNTLYLTNLSDKEEKKDVVEKLKDYIIKDF
jgi:hypothetical protein